MQATFSIEVLDPGAIDNPVTTIDWGDGSKVETHHPGTRTFDFKHRYLDNPTGQPHGAYTVHLTWFDQHNAGNSRDLTVTVHNVAPAIFLPANIDVHGKGLLVVAGFFSDPGQQDHWTATVDYGDGSGVQALTLSASSSAL